MDNSLNLVPGKKYSVIKPFIDFDGIVHEAGESWTYQGTNFLPYDDGLTLHAAINNKPVVYRLQWREEEQAEIIENFNEYVELYNEH
ncbi:MAG TPA: DUF3601 domain-containing protein [Chitinophagaceae bacterium]|jgi:hypothetical protein|nr:DUF3601 domain-containing protein [Chitinophagaceae bacterium]